MSEEIPDAYKNASELKAMLSGFLSERLGKRLDAQKDESKRLALVERFKYGNWFPYAARKAEKLQAATHVAKFTHPSIKQSTDLYCVPPSEGKGCLVGTHLFNAPSLQHDLAASNAADLDGDIKEFLRLSYNGKTVFDGILSQDEVLKSSFSEDTIKADEIMSAFSDLVSCRNPSRAHAFTKQVYWLTGENPSDSNSYVLLAPLYATSLSQKVYSAITTSRFGENTKSGRKARQGRSAFEGGYSDYIDLAIQKIGGSNQQNVSQLNSERYGQNYLLASLPPSWKSREVYAPMRDVFRAFKGRPDVRRIVDELKRFLETDPARNMHTRDLRDDLTAMLVDELMLFTFDIHSLAPGWTADENCQLALEEQYWLDPGRAQEDAEFAEARRYSDWHEAVSSRAANWLNRELTDKSPLSFGDAEHHHWERRFEGIVTEFRRQLDDLQEALRDEGDGPDDPEGEAA